MYYACHLTRLATVCSHARSCVAPVEPAAFQRHLVVSVSSRRQAKLPDGPTRQSRLLA